MAGALTYGYGPNYTVVGGGVPVIPPDACKGPHAAGVFYQIGAIGVANTGDFEQNHAIAMVGVN